MDEIKEAAVYLTQLVVFSQIKNADGEFAPLAFVAPVPEPGLDVEPLVEMNDEAVADMVLAQADRDALAGIFQKGAVN
jgi:hypothetical protein